MTDPATFHLIQQLAQKGLLDLDDIEEVARRLHDEGNDEAASQVRGAFMEAQAEAEPDFRRSQMRVVQMVPRIKLGPDGGNSA